jgi:hypothetical protein
LNYQTILKALEGFMIWFGVGAIILIGLALFVYLNSLKFKSNNGKVERK